ncbi:helix-turn-helix transcriptional regulator [Paraburkholderia humisilvae]|uniref:HTH-type transcriptional activator RhaS n=1 Tax=Paraburkholderia humisilvae TaxID=627669 RepID=A0A6J5EEQ7_9BURK|nr:AraC family transcriptional regulator [Paraburkholderia humisilvae]CAB3764793.1 HTH-type transcriptional activator RhaS [Paraburkholderia humisilvae]
MEASSLPAGGRLADSLKSCIRSEDAWRLPAPADAARAGVQPASCTTSGLALSRWSVTGIGGSAPSRELSATTPADMYTVGVNLRSTDITFLHDGRVTFEGRVMPGMFQVTGPGHSARAVFHASCDVLHLYVPQAVLDACQREASGDDAGTSVLVDDPRVSHDPCVERLGQALLLADEAFTSFGQMYVDSINLALVSRLLELRSRVPLNGAAPMLRKSALPKWRLKRAVEFIDAHLCDAIGLEDVANAAGLTRMHFAAQFRAATGLRPHEYLLRRRIECAQQLLADEEYSLLDAAQLAGFRSQAHFTTVFKRMVGATPKRWRDTQYADA